ncbi:hypothetical protein SSX86_006770 [Deinandra increscens subsp. villosa]|uniref:Uncharacterized protein n=1 Tax=Deinandra increscens subsp. villosa TaxID=3103831 RepID=A0AAP0H436_9ASTR
MDPYNEQILRNEVIYLHSLWHLGPHPPSTPTVNLPPFNPTRFKKPKKKTPKFTPKKTPNFSGREWPVNPPPADPPLTPSGWPELKLKPNPQPTRLPTPEELQKHNWNQVQQKALKAAKEFYSNEDSDENEDDMSEDSDNDNDNEEDDKEYDFFWKLINGDEEFKNYYVKHCGGGGEFSCLVCGGANEKQGKRYKDCIGLVQHSVSIAKTKRVRSHRAYGRAVCKVLGWDIDRLPASIVTDHKCSELKGNDVDDHNKDGKDLKNGVETGDGESMVCENVSAVANVEEENNKNQILNEAEGHTGGAVINLCRNLSSTMVLEPVRCEPH